MQKPVSILYVENGVGFGGALTSLRAFLEYSDKEKFSAILAHSFEDPKFSTFAAIDRCVFLPQPNCVFEGKGVASSMLDLLCRILPHAIHIAALARAYNVSLIHANNDITCNISGIFAAKMIHRPVIVHERDIPAPNSRLSILAARWVDHFIAISTPCKNGLISMGVPAKKITMVPEGLDFSVYRPTDSVGIRSIRKKVELPDGGKLILMVGMIMEWKGQHVLIEAAPKLFHHFPDSRIVIVGEPPKQPSLYLERLKDMIRSRNLQGKICFTGYRSDIPLLMQAADVMIHASVKGEPFGRVVIEAMAMGTPVIATNIGAPPEIITHGKTGFLVPPGDSEILASTILSLFSNPDLSRSVGFAAQKKAREKYSIQRHVGLIQEVYEKLIALEV